MSSYSYMAENNTRVNNARHRNRIALPYLEAVLESKTATPDDMQAATQGIKIIKDFDSLLCRGYVSTGYQYDDNAVLRDWMHDTWQENESIRNGSTAAEEAEAEIAHAIAMRRSEFALDALVQEYFTFEKAKAIFPDSESAYHKSLSDFESLANEALEEEWCYMMDDDR
jgi:hypothetical protein